MNYVQITILIASAVIAGTLTLGLVGSRRANWGLNTLVGLVGAYLGHWMQMQMRFPAIVPIVWDHVAYEFIWSLLGAFLFNFILTFTRGSEY